MTFFLQAFVTLFVIIDPPGIVPLFLGLTRGRSVRTKRRLAWQRGRAADQNRRPCWTAIAVQLVAESALAFAAQAR